MRLIKTQHTDFSRDESNFALINTNVSAYKQYKLQRNHKAKIVTQEKELNDLKNEVEELKKIVNLLVKNTNG